MKTIEASASVTNGKTGADERGFSVTVRYVNLSDEIAAEIAGVQKKLRDDLGKRKASGDLTVTLATTGEASVVVNNLDWKEVTKAEREMWKAGDKVLEHAEKHHGVK